VNRASFLAALAAVPFVGHLFKRDPKEQWAADKTAELKSQHYVTHFRWNTYYMAKDGMYATGPDYAVPYEKISHTVYPHGEKPFMEFLPWRA
jgi:hypothetical protein